MSTGPITVDWLLAEAEIKTVLLQYCRGIDRIDESLIRSCYHDDAIDDHGNFVGSASAFVEWVVPLLRKYDTTMHFVGNMLIEPDTDAHDVAHSETYGIAYHRGEPGKEHRNFTTAFRYVDRFERRACGGAGPEWRIAHRVAVSEWVRHDPPDVWREIPEGFIVGRRDHNDPVYGFTDEIHDRASRATNQHRSSGRH